MAIERKPIDAGIIQRVTQGVKYIIRGIKPETWMSPNQPIQPVAQEAIGRQNDYQVGQNLNYLQRTQSGQNLNGASFVQLRALAQNYDLLRLAIETRKDQVSRLDWTIKAKDKNNNSEQDRVKELTKFFTYPDKINNWDSWLRQIVEDVLVIDAPTIYPRLTNGKKLFSLDLIDGATITRMIDDSGRVPVPPSVAYQQILKGVPAVDYSADELIYMPRNLRTNSIYGYSPVEQIMMSVNIAIRRQLSQLQYYTEGNVPDCFISVPENWTPNQIASFQQWWDSVNAGNTGERRKGKFIPGNTKILQTTENPLKDEYDEWLAKIICYAFSLSPQSLSKQMNRASADSQNESSQEEGLEPIKKFIKGFIDFIIVKYFGYDDVEFAWKKENDINILTQAQADDISIKNGSLSVDEVRETRGLEKIGMGNAIFTAMGIEFVKDLIDPAYQEEKLIQSNPSISSDLKGSTGNVLDNKLPDKTEKLEKSQKKKPVLKAINRDRASVNKNTRQFKKFLAKFLRSQGKKIASQIVGNLKKADIPDDVDRIRDDIDFQGWSVIVGDVQNVLSKMGADGLKMASLQLGGIVDNEDMVSTADAHVIEYSKFRAAELVGMRYNKDGDLVPNPSAKWTITDSTRDMLQVTITQALEEGWSNEKLADEIENNYAFSSSRADTIARTEIKRADSQGSLAAYKSSGVVQGKESLLSFDYDDDDECQENADAGVIGLDELFPSGDDAPPYHPNCRCDLIPALIEKEDQDDEDFSDLENNQNEDDR